MPGEQLEIFQKMTETIFGEESPQIYLGKRSFEISTRPKHKECKHNIDSKQYDKWHWMSFHRC